MTSGETVALDDPAGASLSGHHAHLGRRLGRAVSYLRDVATFSSVSAHPGPDDWSDLARLLGPGAFADMFSCPALPPREREPVFVLEGRQPARSRSTNGSASRAAGR